MEFKVLGPLEVHRENAVLPLGGPGQRALLAVLILCANEVVSTDRLSSLLWEDDPPDTARHILQINISRLRKILEDDPSNPSVLLTCAPGYQLRAPSESLDAAIFEGLVGAGRGLLHDDPARASAKLSDALALWRGDTLADLQLDPSTLPGVSRLEELRVSATEDRIEAELALGHHAEMVGDLRRLASEHPLRERVTQQLMVALYRSGRQTEALDTYETARTRLASELGIDPGPALQALERAVLLHDPSLDVRPEPRPEVGHSDNEVEPPPVDPDPEGVRNDDGISPSRSRRHSTRLIGIGALAVVTVIAAIALPRAFRSSGQGGRSAGAEPRPLLLHLDSAGRRLGEVSGVTAVHGFRPRIIVGEGAIWVSALAGLYRIDPSNPDAEDSVPVRAGALAIGFHNVWDAGDLVLTEIDPATADSIRRMGRRLEPVVAVGAGGVWTFQDGSLIRFDPRTGEWNGRVAVDGTPADIAVSGQTVWYVDFFTGSLTAIDVGSMTVDGEVTIPGSPDIVNVGLGYVWVVERLSGVVSVVDPVTMTLVRQISVTAPATGLAVGAHSIWVTARNALYSINPSTFETTSVGLGARALGLAVDPTDDSLWVYVGATPIASTPIAST